MSKQINHDRHRFFGTAAMTIAAAQLGVIGCANESSSNTTCLKKPRKPSQRQLSMWAAFDRR